MQHSPLENAELCNEPLSSLLGERRAESTSPCSRTSELPSNDLCFSNSHRVDVGVAVSHCHPGNNNDHSDACSSHQEPISFVTRHVDEVGDALFSNTEDGFSVFDNEKHYEALGRIRDMGSDAINTAIAKQLVQRLPQNLHRRTDLPQLTYSQLHRLAFYRSDALCMSADYIQSMWKSNFFPFLIRCISCAASAVKSFKNGGRSEYALRALRAVLQSCKVKVEKTTILFQNLCNSRFTLSRDNDELSNMVAKAQAMESVIQKFNEVGDCLQAGTSADNRDVFCRADIYFRCVLTEQRKHLISLKGEARRGFPLLDCTYNHLDIFRDSSLLADDASDAAKALLADYVACGVAPLSDSEEDAPSFITLSGDTASSGVMLSPVERVRAVWDGNDATARVHLQKWKASRQAEALDALTDYTLADITSWHRAVSEVCGSDENTRMGQVGFYNFCQAVKEQHPWLSESWEHHWSKCLAIGGKMHTNTNNNEPPQGPRVIGWAELLLYMRDQKVVSSFVRAPPTVPHSVAVLWPYRAVSNGGGNNSNNNNNNNTVKTNFYFSVIEKATAHIDILRPRAPGINTPQQRQQLGMSLATYYFQRSKEDKRSNHHTITKSHMHGLAASLASSRNHIAAALAVAVIDHIYCELFIYICREIKKLLMKYVLAYNDNKDADAKRAHYELRSYAFSLKGIVSKAAGMLQSLCRVHMGSTDTTSIINAARKVEKQTQSLLQCIIDNETRPLIAQITFLSDTTEKMVKKLLSLLPDLVASGSAHYADDDKDSMTLVDSIRMFLQDDKAVSSDARALLCDFIGCGLAPVSGTFRNTHTDALFLKFQILDKNVVDHFRGCVVSAKSVDAAEQSIKEWLSSRPAALDALTEFTLDDIYGFLVVIDIVCDYDVDGMNKEQFGDFCQKVKEYHPWLSEHVDRHWHKCKRSGKETVGWVELLLYLRDVKHSSQVLLILDHPDSLKEDWESCSNTSITADSFLYCHDSDSLDGSFSNRTKNKSDSHSLRSIVDERVLLFDRVNAFCTDARRLGCQFASSVEKADVRQGVLKQQLKDLSFGRRYESKLTRSQIHRLALGTSEALYYSVDYICALPVHVLYPMYEALWRYGEQVTLDNKEKHHSIDQDDTLEEQVAACRDKVHQLTDRFCKICKALPYPVSEDAQSRLSDAVNRVMEMGSLTLQIVDEFVAVHAEGVASRSLFEFMEMFKKKQQQQQSEEGNKKVFDGNMYKSTPLLLYSPQYVNGPAEPDLIAAGNMDDDDNDYDNNNDSATSYAKRTAYATVYYDCLGVQKKQLPMDAEERTDCCVYQPSPSSSSSSSSSSAKCRASTGIKEGRFSKSLPPCLDNSTSLVQKDVFAFIIVMDSLCGEGVESRMNEDQFKAFYQILKRDYYLSSVVPLGSLDDAWRACSQLAAPSKTVGLEQLLLYMRDFSMKGMAVPFTDAPASVDYDDSPSSSSCCCC